MFCCKEAARLLSEALDHKLTFSQRAGLQFHLFLCRFCRYFDRDLHRFEAALRSYSQEIDADAAPGQTVLQPEARQRILQAMERESS